MGDGQLPILREKLASLSEFVREVKVNFTRFYNKRHGRRGYFWGDRFKSLIVEQGETLINCLAYIDLNPVRAGIVQKPEEYRWSSWKMGQVLVALLFSCKDNGDINCRKVQPAKDFRVFAARSNEELLVANNGISMRRFTILLRISPAFTRCWTSLKKSY